ncbi:uncharacterized protein LOC131215872 [Anopheles bellator]|uniref:uncharacterized protein LOC131215872 n=1 Tax=Anopheles bellator TaxID=139047 RepID=UPI0026482D22|nr:uncharacterized protein LOC131215872 [Anopheles bellator]
MRPTSVACLVLAVCASLWQPSGGFRPTNTNPTVTELGTNAATLVQCFDKTVFAKSLSPTLVSFINNKAINYVKVETLNPGMYGGVNVEVKNGGATQPNIVLTITDGSGKSIFKSNVQVTMFCAP